MAEHDVEVLIVGAGVSGVGAACHLSRDRPGTSYAVLERRAAVGGTWDLFRYPGIRSDSDMFTFGYNFRPWHDLDVLAGGPAIQDYVAATAAEYGVTEHIRFGRTVQRASWSTAQGRWTVEVVTADGESERYTCRFLLACTGYYNYDAGFRPTFAGEDRFRGRIVHPQHWPEDLDYRDQQVVVIGSGATAVTLVPAMAGDAAHVTMLQRSPSYILSIPSRDAISAALRRVLPAGAVYRAARARNIAIQRAIYALARSRPQLTKRLLLRMVRSQLGPDADLQHFTPRYDPWDQRLCMVPNGDLFRVIREGQASVVTDEVQTLTETGVQLRSGGHLPADVIITATGLDVQMLGGAELVVDGRPVVLNRAVTYKAVLVEGVPNAAMIFGYTNASWTLKADLAAEYVCRLLNHMDAHGYTQVVAHAEDGDRGETSVLGSLSSGYVRRGNDRLPRQGTRAPWQVLNNYLVDAPALRYRPIEDGVLRFTGSAQPGPAVTGDDPALSGRRAEA